MKTKHATCIVVITIRAIEHDPGLAPRGNIALGKDCQGLYQSSTA
jgi:hypothetical protein